VEAQRTLTAAGWEWVRSGPAATSVVSIGSSPYVELVKFVETMLLTAFSALAPEPWRGVLRIEERLPLEAQSELASALPARPEETELRRAMRAAMDSYLELRPQLAAERGMPLAEQVVTQVLEVLRPGKGERPRV
jgi:hypothetical protein